MYVRVCVCVPLFVCMVRACVSVCDCGQCVCTCVGVVGVCVCLSVCICTCVGVVWVCTCVGVVWVVCLYVYYMCERGVRVFVCVSMSMCVCVWCVSMCVCLSVRVFVCLCCVLAEHEHPVSAKCLLLLMSIQHCDPRRLHPVRSNTHTPSASKRYRQVHVHQFIPDTQSSSPTNTSSCACGW